MSPPLTSIIERCLTKELWLEEAYEARDPNLVYIGLPEWDPVRPGPRLQRLLRRIGLPQK